MARRIENAHGQCTDSIRTVFPTACRSVAAALQKDKVVHIVPQGRAMGLVPPPNDEPDEGASSNKEEAYNLVAQFKEFEALLLRDGDVEAKALELQAAAGGLDAKFSTDCGVTFGAMARKMTSLIMEMKDASDAYTELLQNCHADIRKCDDAFDHLELSRSNVRSAFEELAGIIECCRPSFVTDVSIEVSPDAEANLETADSSLQKRAVSSKLNLEVMHQCIKVKQEYMEESFVKEAQLESSVAAMSADVSHLSRMLEECKEMLECCVCLQRAVRIVLLPCGHHFCGSTECYSSRMLECPTCRTGITGRTPLFGACVWLADAFEGMEDEAAGDKAGQARRDMLDQPRRQDADSSRDTTAHETECLCLALATAALDKVEQVTRIAVSMSASAWHERAARGYQSTHAGTTGGRSREVQVTRADARPHSWVPHSWVPRETDGRRLVCAPDASTAYCRDYCPGRKEAGEAGGAEGADAAARARAVRSMVALKEIQAESMQAGIQVSRNTTHAV